MAVATTFDRNVFKAYEWLSENYKEGDRIYLFGFSRGAYQVRVLAGMIERVGLLHKGNYTHIPSAYKLYKATTEKSSISKVILQKLGISRAIKTNVELGIIGKEPGAKMKDLGTPLQKSKEMCAIFKKAFS
ncbi:hypothetical protein PTI98_011613 [Pleurotus ostreatus]|nr:hypothetical protein PTI98_011613 [Pleurotus ostreatus]